MNQLVHVLPGRCARFRSVFVRAIRKADRVQAFAAQPVDIIRAVIDVDIGADLLLLFHEAEIPVRDAVLVEPVNRLFHRRLVEKMNEQPVCDDPDACPFVGELA